MKKYLVLAVFLLLGAALAEAPSLTLDYAVTPTSVYPGGSAQVIVNIDNLEAVTDVEDLNIVLTSRNSGVYVVSGRSDLGTLSALSTSSAAFAIKARDNALPGTYILDASGEYTYGSSENGNFKISIPVTVSYRSGLEIFAADTQITPGATEPIDLTFQNSGKGSIKDVIVSLSPSTTYVYPVGNLRSSIKSIGTGESDSLTFQIRASDAAPVGIQPIMVTATYTDAGGNTQTDTQNIGINVVDAGTEVIVSGIKSNLEPGRVGSVVLGIKNVGDVNLEDLYISIDAASSLKINGSNEKMIDSLEVGGTADVTFTFDVSQDADARPANCNITITYQREGGKKQITESKEVGVDVKGSVDLRVVDHSISFTDNQMEIDIANYGNKDADAIRVDASSNGDELGTGFTDTIKPNKHKVFRFDLPTATSVVIHMSYKDYSSEGGEIVKEETISLKSEDIQAQGDSSGLDLVILVVIVIVVLFLWRRRGTKKVNIDVSKYK